MEGWKGGSREPLLGLPWGIQGLGRVGFLVASSYCFPSRGKIGCNGRHDLDSTLVELDIGGEGRRKGETVISWLLGRMARRETDRIVRVMENLGREVEQWMDIGSGSK